MSNEISASLTLQYSKGGNAQTVSSGAFSANAATAGTVRNVVTVTTGDGVISLGGVATPGYVVFHNLDATNFIIIGSDGTLYPTKVMPGQWAMIQWNAAAIHCKADTASCLLEYFISNT